MALPLLTPSDAGANARDKINAAIAEARKVADKANAADVSAATATAAAADARARAADTKADGAAVVAQQAANGVATAQLAARMAPPSSYRPGDGARAFTFVASLAALAGEADALAPLDGSKIAFAAAGGVVRLVGQGILAAREAEPIEPGRIREVRAAFRRRANASDPSNDTVRAGLLWLDQTKNPMPGPAFAVVADLDTLTTSSGRQEVRAYVAASAGEGVTIVAPAGAAYFRRFVYNFGLDGQTDVETLAGTDVTGLAIPPTVTTDTLNRIAAQESLNLGPRMDAVESRLQAPNSLTFQTRSDAAGSNIAATVTTIDLRGDAAVGDGAGGLFARVVGGLPAGTDGFTSRDGAVWARVSTAQALFNATFRALLPGFIASLPAIPADESQIPASGGVYRSGGNFLVIPPSA